MADTCRSCGTKIRWALTAKRHRIPLDVDPVPPDAQGALVLVEDEKRVVWAYGMSDLAERMAERLNVKVEDARILIVRDYEAGLSHFATCPNADRHRRQRQARNS